MSDPIKITVPLGKLKNVYAEDLAQAVLATNPVWIDRTGSLPDDFVIRGESETGIIILALVADDAGRLRR